MSKKKIIANIISVLDCIAMIILSWLFLDNLHRIAVIVSISLFFVLGILIPILSKNHPIIYRILLFSLIILSIILIAYIILDRTGLLYKFKDTEEIKKFIIDSGKWGIIVFFLLNLLQVLILPIPAAVTMVIGVMIYGPHISFLISTVATIAGSIILFWLGKTFGRKIAYWMFGKEKAEKYAKILSDKGKGIFIIMMLFPFFPDDLICIIAGVTSMTYRFFLISMIITRTIVVAVTCYFGSGDIIPFSGWGIPVWIAIFICLIFALIFIKKLINKKRNAKIPIIKKFK